MSPHQAIAVAVRLFAVWLGVYVLRTLPAFYYAKPGEVPGLGFAVLVLALTGLLALAMWFFPRTIARKLLSPPIAEAAPSAVPDTWLAMGCALIGLWMLTSALPTLVWDAFVLYSTDSSYQGAENIKPSVAYYSVEVVIAFWLVFGAKGFRKLFWWAQNAGINKLTD